MRQTDNNTVFVKEKAWRGVGVKQLFQPMRIHFADTYPTLKS